ncbi:hypothetical protein HYD67_00830 [Mycoplasmopsis bovis]|nr:hypothetical protein [Mycoplasmopsis bovis]QQH54799.1 hypothetical protein HYD67_00830 [Mycoplasmopsis bovis]
MNIWQIDEFLNKPQFIENGRNLIKDNNLLLKLIKTFVNVKLKMAKWCIELLNECKEIINIIFIHHLIRVSIG